MNDLILKYQNAVNSQERAIYIKHILDEVRDIMEELFKINPEYDKDKLALDFLHILKSFNPENDGNFKDYYRGILTLEALNFKISKCS